MNELTKGPWKAKRLATYQEPGWVVLWPDKGGTHMRRLDSNGNFTGPDAALIAAAPELLEALKDCVEDSEQAVSDYLQKHGPNYRPERLTAMSETVAKARSAIAKATTGA